ncbi:type II CAAX endopeptidase family protein, partial [Nocardiopsis trehalosi]|uniref:type II CAAX endopeptidase family protein n=1 Tax=Nocardiopsis trehalosi TaxID=109329 RepID=UPI0012FA9EE5
MRNTPPPPGSSWSPEPQRRDDFAPAPFAHQQEQVWAWPPGPATGEAHAAQAWAWPPPAPPRRTGGLGRPAPGTRYHRLARTHRHRWWRPLLAAFTAVGLIVVVQLVMGLAAVVIAVVNGMEATGDSFFGAPVPDLAFQLVVLATMTPIVVFTAWAVQRRPVGTLFSVTGRLRWGWLGTCLLLSVPALVVSFSALYGLMLAADPGASFVGEFAGGGGFAAALVVIVLLVPFQASAEEIALRGFVMQTVGSYGAGADEPRGDRPVARFLRTPVLGILISGTVFTLLHAYVGWGLLDVAVFGIAMAWLTWYTGGLEAAIALHVLHNVVAFGLSAYEGTLADAGTGGGSWQGVVSTAIEVGVFCLLVVYLARRRGVRATVPDDPAAPPAPHPAAPAAPAVPPGPAYGGP